MKLLDHIQSLRKAQLQEYYLRWFPREEMTSDTEKLVHQLTVAMCDPKIIRQRFDRLSRSGREFLTALLTRPGFRGTVEEIRATPRGRSIESFEVESLVKNLTSEGWIIPVSEASNGVRHEIYVLPEEIGRGLGVTVDVEQREATVMLSAQTFLEKQRASGAGGDAALEELTAADSIRERIAGLQDPLLRETVELALANHGGILPLSAWDGGEQLHRKEWRDALESSALGTTGVLSLKAYGVELEEECLVVFQELVESLSRAAITDAVAENEGEYSLGVDLLIDIRRVLEIARSEALEVTREGAVFKKTEERIDAQLMTSSYRNLFESSPVQHILALTKKLRLLDQGDHFLRTDPIRRRLWLKKRLSPMIRSIFEIYQNEYRGSRWSFHQRMVREIFLEELLRTTPGTWIAARPFFTMVIARFVASLESLGVGETFTNLQHEEFHHETLMVPFNKLSRDLSYWVVHRLALAGLVDLGLREGKFNTLTISSLGRRFFKLDQDSQEATKVVVNPDFEILVFPGGRRVEEVHYALGSFAERTASDWVKRYRLTPDSVKRGVLAGFDADEVVSFLEKYTGTALPSNVAFSIREWAEGIEPVLRQRVLLLRTQSSQGADQVCAILEKHEVAHDRVGKLAVIVRGVRNERKVRDLQEVFQNAGLILE